MATYREVRARVTELKTKMRGILDDAGGNDLSSEAVVKFDEFRAEAEGLERQAERIALVDDMDRRAAGQPVGTGDANLDREIAKVGLLDVARAQMGGTDAAASRAREISAELERRSGRKAQGLLWHMGAPANVEQRVLTTTLPAGGPGSNIIGTDYRPDLFIDRLRNGTVVRQAGATVLSNLSGNVAIPRRKASVTVGWVAENSPLSVSDPQFDQVTLTPKHGGVISEWSRNMILQASPDVEQLARNDMALMLGETLDTAALNGLGTSNQPRGVLNTSGIGSVALGNNGGPITYDALADLMGSVADANAAAGSLAFITNTKVRRAAGKLKDSQARPYGLDTVFQGVPLYVTNLVPSNGSKGTGTGLSVVVYGNWNDLLIGVWSELDILVNPYESTAYSKGNVQIRAMMTVDIAVRHPESFAAITDVAA